MSNVLMQLLPLGGVFLLGALLRKIGLVQERHSSWLLKLVFYIGLPIIIFQSVVRIELDKTLPYLAVFPVIIMIVTVIAALLLRQIALRRVPAKTFATMLAGAAIMNQSFLIPFVASAYGPDGLARVALIESFNAILIFSLLYVVIAETGNKRPKARQIVQHLASSPPLWALIAGILFKLSGSSLSESVMALFVPFAWFVSLGLLLALGIKFRARIKNPKVFLVGISLRMILGAAIGIGFVELFHLKGLDAEIILIASMAPIGLNSITLAEIEKLDVSYAVSAVSGSLVVGLVVTPFIIYFMQTVGM